MYNYHHFFNFQNEISENTISVIKGHLLKLLENISKIKDERHMMADLWCHFGKVLVSSVDEGTV